MAQQLHSHAMILRFPHPLPEAGEAGSDAELVFQSRSIAIDLIKVLVRGEGGLSEHERHYLQQLNRLFSRYGYPPLRYDA